MRNIEEPKKGQNKKKDNPSDIKQSPMYKIGVDRKTEAQMRGANLKGKEYIADTKKDVKQYKTGKAPDLNAMKESLPMSNKTIEYYNNRYQ